MKVHKISFLAMKKINNNGITEKDYSLKRLTTFKLGGNCKYYLEINTLCNFVKVMEYLKDKDIEIFVLGNGSNVLISDRGYSGVVIRLRGDFIQIESREEFLEVGSGALLSQLYAYCVERGLCGFEEGGLIPATLGGAVYMNAQTQGFLMSNLIEYVVAYDFDKIVYLNKEECCFANKHSIFQEKPFIILRVGLRLEKGAVEKIKNRHHTASIYRKENHPIAYRSAGCVYKKNVGLPISKMLDDMGIKGERIGGAYISEKHANFILCDGDKAQDVYKLMKFVEKKFFEKYNIYLQREIILLGDFNED